MTRPTLSGTPDAVPAIEADEILAGEDLDLMDRWLAQADTVVIADELSRLDEGRRASGRRGRAPGRARAVRYPTMP